MRGRWVLVLLLSLISTWGVPRAASAQSSDDVTRSAARGLGYSGVEAYQAGDYETASERLEKAYMVLRAPSLGLWSARALVKRGKLVEASGRYLEVTTLEVSGGDVEVQKRSQAEARSELDALGPRIPSLTLKLEGAMPAEVTVMLDVRPLATALVGERLSLNPGRHVIEARRGDELKNAEVVLEEQQHETIVLKFGSDDAAAVLPPSKPEGPVMTPLAPAPADGAGSSSSQKTLGVVVLAAGGAGIVFGGVTGALALRKWNQIKDDEQCKDERCLDDEGDTSSLVNGYNRMRTFSTIGFVAGGVLAAGGAVLLFTAPSSKSGVALRIGPGSAELSGRF